MPTHNDAPTQPHLWSYGFAGREHINKVSCAFFAHGEDVWPRRSGQRRQRASEFKHDLTAASPHRTRFVACRAVHNDDVDDGGGGDGVLTLWGIRAKRSAESICSPHRIIIRKTCALRAHTEHEHAPRVFCSPELVFSVFTTCAHT